MNKYTRLLKVIKLLLLVYKYVETKYMMKTKRQMEIKYLKMLYCLYIIWDVDKYWFHIDWNKLNAYFVIFILNNQYNNIKNYSKKLIEIIKQDNKNMWLIYNEIEKVA